jgi:hypothetical protein
VEPIFIGLWGSHAGAIVYTRRIARFSKGCLPGAAGIRHICRARVNCAASHEVFEPVHFVQ